MSGTRMASEDDRPRRRHEPSQLIWAYLGFSSMNFSYASVEQAAAPAFID
jgi:hypothetical protein